MPCGRAHRRANSCRCRSRQRHNAGCLAGEVVIHYPFHPRFGQSVEVVHRRRFAGAEHLVVVQRDGTLALIPAWMSEETARSAALTACPRLSVDRLMDLRRQLDSLHASRGESAPQAGGDHAPKTEPAARLVPGGATNGTSPDHPEGHPRSPHRRASGRGDRGRQRQGKDRRQRNKRGGT